MTSGLAIYGLIGFSLMLIAIGNKAASERNPDSYLIENKMVPLYKVVFGVFSVVGGGEFIYVTALAFDFGLGSWTLFLGFSIGCALFIWAAPKIRAFNKDHKADRERDVYSIPDFVYIFYGRPVSLFATVLTVLALGALLLIQFALGGEMLRILTGLPYGTCVIIMAATVLLYTYQGGFNGILVTDVIQIATIFTVFPLLAYFGFRSPETTLSSVIEKSQAPDTGTLLLLLVGGICWVFGGGDIWERLLSAKSDKIAKKALLLNFFQLALFGGILAYLGTKVCIFLSNAGKLDANGKDAAFMLMLGELGPEMRTLVALALYAALVSTADTELFTISTIIGKETWRGKLEPVPMKVAQKLVLLVALVSVILSLVLSQYLVTVYYFLINVFVILGALAIPAFLGRGHKSSVLAGLSVSAILQVWLIANEMYAEPISLLVALPPLALGLATKNNLSVPELSLRGKSNA